MTRILFDFFRKQDYPRARFMRVICGVVLLHMLVHRESTFLCAVSAQIYALRGRMFACCRSVFFQRVHTQFMQTCRKKSNDDAFMRNQIFEAFTLANEMRVNAINHYLTRPCARVVV